MGHTRASDDCLADTKQCRKPPLLDSLLCELWAGSSEMNGKALDHIFALCFALVGIQEAYKLLRGENMCAWSASKHQVKRLKSRKIIP